MNFGCRPAEKTEPTSSMPRPLLPIPAEKVAGIQNLGKYIDKHVIMGIRPEDIEDVAFRYDPATTLRPISTLLSPWVPKFMLLSSGDNSFIARPDAATKATDGGHLKVFNMQKIYLFDKDTEEVTARLKSRGGWQQGCSLWRQVPLRTGIIYMACKGRNPVRLAEMLYTNHHPKALITASFFFSPQQ